MAMPVHEQDSSHTLDTQMASTTAAYTHHPSLWFVDGSVVIQAETTHFRVHMSQLSRHSVFFRDLFSLPQPPVWQLPDASQPVRPQMRPPELHAESRETDEGRTWQTRITG